MVSMNLQSPNGLLFKKKSFNHQQESVMAKVPTKITARIEYWESKGLSKMKSTKTKTYKETIHKLAQLVDGIGIFGGTNYTMPDFKLSVDRHSSQVFSSNYFPTNKSSIRNLTLNLFLYSPFGTGEFQSAFRRNVHHPLIPKTVRRDNSGLFETLVSLYIKESNNGIKIAEYPIPIQIRG